MEPEDFPLTATVEGRIDWISLCQNHPNALESHCLESVGVQSQRDERGTPDKMHTAPAAKCPVRLKATIQLCLYCQLRANVLCQAFKSLPSPG